MSDLISREVVRRLINSERSKEQMLHILGTIPTVDAEPIKHGHWELRIVPPVFVCSECREESDVKYNYCPQCGCKMDEVEQR